MPSTDHTRPIGAERTEAGAPVGDRGEPVELGYRGILLAERQRLPRVRLHGYTGAATARREAGRFDAAEAMVRETLARFPDMPAAHFEVARLLAARGNTSDALLKWVWCRERFPDEWV